MAQFNEEVTIEQARSMAEAKVRHYEFLEKLGALMAEYEVEIFGTGEEIAFWTTHEGETTSTESSNNSVTHEWIAKEIETSKPWNTPSAEEIFKRRQIWAAQSREYAARRQSEQQTEE